MMVQCWLAAGVFVEVYVSVLISCQWDAGPVWRWWRRWRWGVTHLRQLWMVMDVWYFRWMSLCNIIEL